MCHAVAIFDSQNRKCRPVPDRGRAGAGLPVCATDGHLIEVLPPVFVPFGRIASGLWAMPNSDAAGGASYGRPLPQSWSTGWLLAWLVVKAINVVNRA